MSDNKKYYYLKLKENFFDTEEIKLLESLDNGYMYSNILLKLYLKSLKSDGKLIFRDKIPYNPKMISTVTGHNVDVVEKALGLFKEFGLIEVLDNGTIFISDIQNFIGKSSTEADRKRTYRTKIESEKLLLGGEMSGQKSDISPPEIELELELKINNIFSFWNTNKVGITHNKLTTEMKNAIATKIKKYEFENIKKAISRLCQAVHDQKYFYDTKWNLKNFMQQKNGLPNWLDEGQIWNDYCSKIKEPKQKPNNTVSDEARRKTIEYMERNGIEC
jgi:predicted phage replisome organizer